MQTQMLQQLYPNKKQCKQKTTLLTPNIKYARVPARRSTINNQKLPHSLFPIIHYAFNIIHFHPPITRYSLFTTHHSLFTLPFNPVYPVKKKRNS